MRYIGWVLFCFGLLSYFYIFFLWSKKDNDLEHFGNMGKVSIMTIGVGGYLIKNFT